jgi:hypothetical protein
MLRATARSAIGFGKAVGRVVQGPIYLTSTTEASNRERSPRREVESSPRS